MRREDQLILCCARSVIDDKIAGRIVSLLSQEIDWRRLVERTIHHRVTPIVYRTLRSVGCEAIPADVLNAMSQRCSAIARRNLHLSAELIRVADWVDEQGIAFIPYKGPVLAILAYGNVGMREFGDLDILVHPNDYGRLRKSFLESGYRLADDWGWECTMVDYARGTQVDVHQGLAPAQFPLGLDFRRLYADRAVVPALGRSIRTFRPEDMLLVLCIQLIKDCWETRSMRLSKLCDIAEMLRAGPTLDWAKLIERAEKAGLVRVVAASVLAAHDLLDAPLASLAPRLTNRALARALTGHVAGRLLQQDNQDAENRLSSARFHFMVRERWRDKLYPPYHTLWMRLTPNDLDRAVLPLPEFLDFLYYIVRPLRVCSTRAMTGLKGLRAWLVRRNR